MDTIFCYRRGVFFLTLPFNGRPQTQILVTGTLRSQNDMKFKFFSLIIVAFLLIAFAGYDFSMPTTPDDIPEFAKENLLDIATEGLKDKQWAKLKIPGFKEQQRNAFTSGKKIWKNVSPGYANVIYDARIDNGVITIVLDGAGLAQSKNGGKTWKQISYGIEGFGSFFPLIFHQ